jgi:hypothetical protein
MSRSGGSSGGRGVGGSGASGSFHGSAGSGGSGMSMLGGPSGRAGSSGGSGRTSGDSGDCSDAESIITGVSTYLRTSASTRMRRIENDSSSDVDAGTENEDVHQPSRFGYGSREFTGTLQWPPQTEGRSLDVEGRGYRYPAQRRSPHAGKRRKKRGGWPQIGGPRLKRAAERAFTGFDSG